MSFAIVVQIAFIVIAIVVAAFFGRVVALSALAGGVVALVPNLVFAAYLKVAGKPSVTRFFVGEAVKVVVMIALSLVIWRDYGSFINAVAYWAALILVVKVHSLGLLRAAN